MGRKYQSRLTQTKRTKRGAAGMFAERSVQQACTIYHKTHGGGDGVVKIELSKLALFIIL